MIAHKSTRKRLITVFKNVLLHFGHCTYENTQTHKYVLIDLQVHVSEHICVHTLLSVF